jgi:hypothetical protein
MARPQTHTRCENTLSVYEEISMESTRRHAFSEDIENRDRYPHDKKEHKSALVVQKGKRTHSRDVSVLRKQSKQLELTRGRVRYDENSGVGNSLFFRRSLQLD